jgi:small ligand-binding sensory domain FIST
MLDITLETLKFINSPTDFLIRKFSQQVDTSGDAVEIGELRRIAEREEVEMRMSEAQARVAQELAIAKRIETAEEVEMTEFYDYSGKGHVGLEASGEAFNLGAGGSGRRVSKRKFRFKGGAIASDAVPAD